MNYQMFYRVKALGYCCPYAFFFAHQEEKEIYLAQLLRVSERTIRFWRKKLREDQLACSKKRYCLLIHTPQEPPAAVAGTKFPEE
jgi:hypothetical protein